MQFITNGPDIPDELLHAHEEGRVVFFCGAGISYPAGLLGFKGLVKKIYKLVGDSCLQHALERNAFKKDQFDITLNLLEQRLPDNVMRNGLAQALIPNVRKKGATKTHEALLRLAGDHKGGFRLVTTNFDRLFEVAAQRSKQKIQAFAAPMLPTPRNSRWSGLVYLHGFLGKKPDQAALKRLVITSADFGAAYLVERWAARFVSELFRNYNVCFVGYSLNDPILRYMTDALAADRLLGELIQKAWVFADHQAGQESSKRGEWEAKGITPILYEVPAGTCDHSALHETLQAWAELYRDGVMGKEHTVFGLALAHPSASTKQDDFISRMLWALSDNSGLPAKRFANFEPAPSLDWLDEFSKSRYQAVDLKRFGVAPSAIDNRSFSLLNRPAPYSLAPQMSLTSLGGDTEWDKVMSYLGYWLVRHLNDPKLVIWIAQQGGRLHGQWSKQIEYELSRLAKLERESKTSELDEIRAQSPNAIPCPLMRKLWGLVLSGRVIGSSSHKSYKLNPYDWVSRVKQNGLTTLLRLELRELLAPRILLRKPFIETQNETRTLRSLVNLELELASNHVSLAIKEASESLTSVLHLLLTDVQQALCDTLDLFQDLDEADPQHDQSLYHLRSISDHPQNNGFHEWVVLIELLRDAWLEIQKKNTDRAKKIAQLWFDFPYPTFKRLALFAAAEAEIDCIAPSQWVDWLTIDDAYWLWSINTKRESLRLLVQKGSFLQQSEQDKLEVAILAGPPRAIYFSDLDEKKLQLIREHSIWLRLAKLESSGLMLGGAAKTRLNKLSAQHPDLQLDPDERDEFSSWVGPVEDLTPKSSNITLRKRRDLVRWLQQQPSPKSYDAYVSEDIWRSICRKHPLNSLYALSDVSQENLWPVNLWCEALQVWSGKKLIRRSWKYVFPIVKSMPDSVLNESMMTHAITRWIESVSEVLTKTDGAFVELCYRILVLPIDAASSIAVIDGKPVSDPVAEAINHPLGHITTALLNYWLATKPNDNDLLPVEVKPIFTKLCDVGVDRYRHARVLLASRLISLFRVDSLWTKQRLLPLFDWTTSEEAKAVWDGFLWAPRAYPQLLIAFKPALLETVDHYNELGSECRQQFVRVLTYAALNKVDGFKQQEFAGAMNSLPIEGLEQSAWFLWQTLEAAGDRREENWENQVKPFWQNIWPKSKAKFSPRIVTHFSCLAISAGTSFQDALSTFSPYLNSLKDPSYVLHYLRKQEEKDSKVKVISRYPADALCLLSTIINEQSQLPLLYDLNDCLEKIKAADNGLSKASRYTTLAGYLRR